MPFPLTHFSFFLSSFCFQRTPLFAPLRHSHGPFASPTDSDPIDGTTNYVHGLTDVVICIGLAIDQELVLGVIYNPFLDEMVIVPRVLMRLCAFVCVLLLLLLFGCCSYYCHRRFSFSF